MAKEKGFYQVKFVDCDEPFSILYFDGQRFWSYGDDDTVELGAIEQISSQPMQLNQGVGWSDTNQWLDDAEY
ncbi:hypothetical protein [Aliikangiella coralliicola]|uniref:Uncharacterized protein n=1 Tax=Aliikangiella coralliicola TaxID=2592383 RepID=A0A545UD24_9GAMM|nr:hypothetical protein [Aliikangiella coralliicola]TQV87370.1 hypothetical protein FLL46_13055 [Aliikangiella coralliicola]